MSNNAALTQLSNLMANVADATADHIVKTTGIDTKHKEAMKTLPENPERGSYWWWVKLCRQNTGQHFLDSGTHYGYGYQRGWLPKDADPVRVEIVNGEEVMARISLPHFLTEMFESDETAEALQKLLEWVGQWYWPKEHWGKCIEELGKQLDEMRHFWDRDDASDTVFKSKEYVESALSQRHDDLALHPYSNLLDHQRGMDKDTYIAEALGEFPTKAASLVMELDIHEGYSEHKGFYTYNSDNDFDQDWIIDTWLGDGYAIVRIHCGCDARSGFSSPVIVCARDPDYVYSWQCDVYCPACEGQWSNMWYFGEEFGKGRTEVHHDPTGQWKVEVWPADTLPHFSVEPIMLMVSGRDIELAFPNGPPSPWTTQHGLAVRQQTVMRRETLPPAAPPHPDELEIGLPAASQVEAGQISAPGMEPVWPHDVSPADARALIRHHEEFIELGDEDEEDYKHPVALICGDDDTMNYPPIDEFSVMIPAGETNLLCPRCGTYSVRLSNPVYGY